MTLPSDPIELGLPHRAPFLFLDAVPKMEPGRSGEGVLRFPAATPFFAGHFPGRPVVPGVLLTEAIAQLAGIVAAAESAELAESTNAADSTKARRSFLLGAIRSMKFPASAGPEEDIVISVEVVADHGTLVQCSGMARVGDRLVAEGAVVLAETKEDF